MTDDQRYNYTAQSYSTSFTIEEGPALELLRKRIAESYEETKRQIDINLYEPLFTHGTSSRPLIQSRFSRLRGWLAERLVTLAEWVGGYEIRD